MPEESDSASSSPQGIADSPPARVVRDIRLVMIVNVATVPLSMATNLILGRMSAEALGWYGAVQIFVSAFNALVILGGAPVFSRMVPAMPRANRGSFLLTYFVLIFGLLSTTPVAGLLIPSALGMALGRFGRPPLGIAYVVCLAVLVTTFATSFLYAVERGPRAAVALRSVMVGYFVASVTGATIFRSALTGDAAGYIWRSTVIIYVFTALLSLFWVRDTPEFIDHARPRLFLPAGFWRVVFYTHMATVVEFAFIHLYPALVLLWLDVVALSRLHAALRFVNLLALVPVMLTSVLAPGLARLETVGLRDEALRQARSALRGCLVVLTPCVFALIVFAPNAMGLFGPDFVPYARILRLVAPMALSGPVVYLGGGMAFAFGALRSYLWVSMAFVVTSVTLAFVVIPRWGLVGAAAAGTLGTLGQQLLMSDVLRRKIGFRSPFRALAAWMVAGVLLMVVERLNPGLVVGIALWIGGLACFAWLGSVTYSEVRALAARALGTA